MVIASLDADDPELRGAASIALAIAQGERAHDRIEERIPHLSTVLERMLTYAALQRIGRDEYGDKLYYELCQYPSDAMQGKVSKLPFLWRREFVYALKLQSRRGQGQADIWGELLAVRPPDLSTVVGSAHKRKAMRSKKTTLS